MTKVSRGKQELLQMECIPTQISTIIFIRTWLKKNHYSTDSSGNKQFYINLSFILSTCLVLLSFDDSDNYQLDLRNTNFEDLIGFEKKLIAKTEYSTRLLNITNSIDVLNIHTSAITDSIVKGINTNTIAVIPTDNLTRSYPFTFVREDHCFALFHHITSLK